MYMERPVPGRPQLFLVSLFFVGASLVWLFEDATNAVIKKSYDSLLSYRWFRHESFEPCLSIACFVLWANFWNIFDKRWDRFVEDKINKKSVPPSHDHFISALIYLAPIILYDFVFPRRIYLLLRPAPTVREMVFDIVVCLILYDAMFFVFHYVLHKFRFMYKTFHAKHHQSTVIQTMDTFRLTLLEAVVEVSFSIIALNVMNCNAMTRMLFDIVIVFLLMELHCGWNFAWQPHNLVPGGILSGSVGHDLHHVYGNCNYGKFFTHFDKLFGTYQSPYPVKRTCQ